MQEIDFEWVSQPCGRENLQETLNKMQSNDIEVWNILSHVVEATSFRKETILFTVVGIRRVAKKDRLINLIKCLEFAVTQTEAQIKDDVVLSEEGREWLDQSNKVLGDIKSSLIS